jgi:hypothetical protein
MKFSIEVGTKEQHRIEFNFNQLLGRVVLKVDGEVVLKKARWFSEPLVDHYEFEIGQLEPVRLRIEKERKLLVGSKYRVFVDHRLTQFHQGV